MVFFVVIGPPPPGGGGAPGGARPAAPPSTPPFAEDSPACPPSPQSRRASMSPPLRHPPHDLPPPFEMLWLLHCTETMVLPAILGLTPFIASACPMVASATTTTLTGLTWAYTGALTTVPKASLIHPALANLRPSKRDPPPQPLMVKDCLLLQDATPLPMHSQHWRRFTSLS